jgi:homogentisate 1,2-dioxygenase
MFQPEDINENDDFLTGLKILLNIRNPSMRKGLAYYVYAGDKSMPDSQAFGTSDGDLCLGLCSPFACFVS